MIVEARFGAGSSSDLTLSEEMLKTTACFHEGDVLIMDRGFISRNLINQMKNKKGVNIYIPVRKNMEIYDIAVGIAENIDAWEPHPTRKDQMICHVNNLGEYWKSDNLDEDVDLNACVVWIQETQGYAVFVTTDTSKSGKQIIETYQLRPEIEKDLRQLKEFWEIEDFKSTKLGTISFHIICLLFGYLFYQLYLLTEHGSKYIGKCLPVILKNYERKASDYYIIYSGDYFCIMKLKEFIIFRDNCSEYIRNFILQFC